MNLTPGVILGGSRLFPETHALNRLQLGLALGPKPRSIIPALIIMMLGLLSEAGWATAPFKIPAQWHEYITLERQFNIHFRRDQIFPGPIEEAIVPLQHWEVSDPHRRDKIDAYRSENLSPIDQDILLANNQKKLRLFCAEIPYFISCKNLALKFGQPHPTRWYAIRIQGQASFLVFDSKNPSRPPFTLKFGQGEHVERNPVSLSDILSQRLRDFPAYAEVPSGFFPEKYLANVWFPNKECFSMTYRSMQPVGIDLKPEQRIYPLAGFLDSFSFDGMTRRQWIEDIYLPALGKYTAIMQQHFGIFVAGHTQNLNIVIDPSHPEHVGFIARDARDMLNDPFTLEVRGLLSEKPLPNDRLRQTPRVYQKWETPEVGSEFPGHHTALFTGQSVNLFESDPARYAQNTRIFLQHYLNESEIISGHKVSLSLEAKRLFMDLDSHKSSFGEWNWRRVQSAIATLVEEIYQSLLQQKFPKPKPEAGWFATSRMIQIVAHYLQKGECMHFIPSSEVKDLPALDLVYFFQDGRLFLKSKERMILATPLLTEKEKAFLQETRVTRHQLNRFKIPSQKEDQVLLGHIFSLELQNTVTQQNVVMFMSAVDIIKIRQDLPHSADVFEVHHGKLIAGIIDLTTAKIHRWMQIQPTDPSVQKLLKQIHQTASCEDSLHSNSPPDLD